MDLSLDPGLRGRLPRYDAWLRRPVKRHLMPAETADQAGLSGAERVWLERDPPKVIAKVRRGASSDAVGGRKSIKLWAHPLLLAGVALAFDVVHLRVPFNILSTGLFDEPTHLATAGRTRPGTLHRRAAPLLRRSSDRVRRHRPESHTLYLRLPRSA